MRKTSRKARRRSRLGRVFRVETLIGLALLFGFAAVRAWDPGPLQLLRLKTFDLYQQIEPRERTSRPVVIVDIDEKSLDALGQWPWPRIRMAELIARLDEMGALVVGLDMVFPEPDRMSPSAIAATAPGLDSEARAALAALPSYDAAFAEALAGARVVLGQAGARAQASRAVDSGPRTSIAFLGADPRAFVIRFPRVLRNVAELEDAAAGRGLVSLAAEPDGIVRRVPALMSAGDQVYPTLAIEMLRVATGETTLVARASPVGVEGVLIGGVFAPTDVRGRMWVHFAPHDPELYVSAVDVIEGRVDPDRFRQRLVLVGASAIGLLDVKATPLDSALPGVEVHAQLLETILFESALSRPDYAPGLELIAAVALGLAMIVLVPRLGPLWALALGAAAAAAMLGFSWRMYAEERVLIDPVYPAISSLGVYAILAFLNYLRNERERDQVRSAFGRYLAPKLVERLAADPDQLALGGETRELTVLFADARGFTTIAEVFRDDPQLLTRLMNRLLTPLSNAILERGGAIDKYMGDAIMAFWNAPLDVEDHEKAACAAALDMRRRLAALNAERKAEAEAADVQFVPLDLGVGINTGACVVGNMGSEVRFDYSALGDPVNVASRLEGLTRSFGAPILVGSATWAAAQDAFAFVEIDRIRVKGKTAPETLYALLGDAELRAAPGFRGTAEAAEIALKRYRAQDWDGAEMALVAMESIDPRGRLGGFRRLYAERIARLRDAPPGPDWDGVETATEK